MSSLGGLSLTASLPRRTTGLGVSSLKLVCESCGFEGELHVPDHAERTVLRVTDGRVVHGDQSPAVVLLVWAGVVEHESPAHQSFSLGTRVTTSADQTSGSADS